MKTLPSNAAPDSAATALHPRAPNAVLRRLPIAAMAALLVIEPPVATAAGAGQPIPVAVTGTVGTGSNPIVLSGQVMITPRIINDTVFSRRTILEIVIDFKGVKGVARTSGGETFVTEAQTVIHRPLLARDAIEVTFPYYTSTANKITAARSAKATFAIMFNARSGISITSAIRDVPTN